MHRQKRCPIILRFLYVLGGALLLSFAAHAAKYLIGAVPRPPHWSGFRVTPVEIEFWHSRLSRLHERIIFKREVAGGDWLKTRLYP